MAVAPLPHPHPTGGPLGAPSADNTEALPCVCVCVWGGGPQGRKETRQRERTTNLESVTATLEASIPQPPGVVRRVSSAHQSQIFPCLFLTFQLQGKRHQLSDGREDGVVSLGPRESLKSLG